MKRAALVVLAVVIVVFVAGFGFIGSAFMGLIPAVDGAIAPGVQLVKDGYVNAFLVDADDGVVLVDCGNDPEAKAIKAALAARKLGPEAVKAIFITHGHQDHIGGCNQFPTAGVYAFEGDRGLVEGTTSANGPLTKWIKPNPVMARKLTATLSEGGTTHVGTLEVQAWNIVGHTGGSAAFLARGVLFLGDSLAGQADGKARVAPYVFSDDQEKCRDSVKALAKKVPADQVKVLAFAHSGPIPGVAALTSFGE
jgi:glyoxylase-like metal-dependent hydrolase (beta-lactamase superfamily II)